jgi:hypothetical protein
MGWADQEIADLIIAARRHHDQNPAKAMRQDYMGRTISRARASAAEAIGEGPAVDLSNILSADEPGELDDAVRHDDPGAMPAGLLTIPGFVAEVMDYSLRTAPYPQPALAFAAALTLQAFLAGRKVRDATDIRTNLYVLALANSGSGKDHPRKVNQRILVEAGLHDVFGETFASGEGIEDRLFTTPSVLFQTDELDGLILAIAQGKDPRWEGVMSVLLKFYTSAGTLYPMRVKAGQSAGVIDQPSLCLLGTAIPKHYYEALSVRMLTNGFLARMLVLEAGSRGRGRDFQSEPPPARLVETARWWADFTPGGRSGNLKAWHPTPALVEVSPQAQAVLADLRGRADSEYERAEKAEDLAATAIWARACEKARKLALVYACSENPQYPKVSEAGARWASDLILYVTHQTLWRAGRHVAETQFHARWNRMLEVLAQWRGRHGDAWMPYWRLSRLLPWTKREIEDVRDALVDQRRIEYHEEMTGGRVRKLYKLRA